MFKFLHLLFAPEGDDTGGGAKLSINDMIDSMADGDDNKDTTEEIDLLDSGKDKDKEEKEEDKEDKEGNKEEKEEKIELDEEEKPDDEELDNIEDVPRKAILKKYPTLFKDFPQLERSYYREQRYAELLPTLDDAKEAVEKAEQYNKFSESILSGDMTSVISSLKGTDEKAYEKLVDNYLPNLGKVDQQAYYHIVGNVVKDTIATMIRAASKESNEDNANNLKAAAIILNKFIFASDDYQPPGKFAKGAVVEESEEARALKSERESLVQQKFDDAVETLGTRSANVIKSTISQHIDPKDSMTDYVKRVAIRDAVDEVESLITGDKRFKGILDNLWKKAAGKGFDKKSLDEIQKAYLSKAKTLLPTVITKHRNAALKGLGRRVTEEKDEKEEIVERDEKEPVTRRTARADNTDKNKTGIPKGMSSLDYLNSD